ncbi:MAG: Smr/MutS family protein, partial [Spirochaetota bacterium]
RGERLEQALEMVNRQIDNALLANLYEFEVIHGKGEGILQTGIQRMLQESPRVDEFYFSRPEHGGTGKTIVKLKR